MFEIKLFVALGVLSFFVHGVRGNLSSGEQPAFSNIVDGASNIVLGIATSVTYKEDTDSVKLARKKDWLYYEMRMVPIRVLRGDVVSYSEAQQSGESVGITVPFRDRSPYFDSGSPKVYFRPHVGLTYVVFLNETKAGTCALSDRRLGILPIHPAIVGSEEQDIWKLLIETLKSVEIPKYLHDELFDCLFGLDISETEEDELLQANYAYYINLLTTVKEKLNDAEGRIKKGAVKGKSSQQEETVTSPLLELRSD